MKQKDVSMLNRFNRLVTKDSVMARHIIRQADYKTSAYLLRCIALTYRDEAVFRNATEMRKIFVKRKLDLAKKYIDKAFSINPNCRDVLFTKGGIYNALGDTFTAIECYIRILELGEDSDKLSNCSESDISYVRMVFNDSRFQLYRLFYDLEDFDLSNKFLDEYKKHLKEGINTIYRPLEDYLMS